MGGGSAQQWAADPEEELAQMLSNNGDGPDRLE